MHQGIVAAGVGLLEAVMLLLLLGGGGSCGGHLVCLGEADAPLAQLVQDFAVVLRLPASLPRAKKTTPPVEENICRQPNKNTGTA